MAAAEQTARARALLDQLDDSGVISLGVLSGADLCTLGAVGHPVCWNPLRDAWGRLDEKDRERLAESSTLGLLHRDLIKDQPPGRGVEALIFPACYRLSAELFEILLSARTCPARIIATHHESRTPPITYFQPRGASAIVEEIPERVENGACRRHRPGARLGVIFSYSPAYAWPLPRAVGPMGDEGHSYHPATSPKPPRLICFFSCGKGGVRGHIS